MRNYSRFIPGEEIEAVEQWSFNAVDTRSQLLAARTDARRRAEDQTRDEAIRQESHAQGFAEGFAQGQARARLEGEHRLTEYANQQGAQAAARLARLFDGAREQLAQSQQVMARGVLELACELARQVLRHELSVNPNVLQPVIREALGLLDADSKSAVVRLNPLDAEMLQDSLQAEFASLSLTLVPDATLKPGGCLVSSAGAVIDGSVDTRWRRAVASLGLDAPWEDLP